MNGPTDEVLTVSSIQQNWRCRQCLLHCSPVFLRMPFFLCVEGLLRSEKFKYLNGWELLSLDLKISNRISVSFTDLYVPCGIDKGPHTEKLVKRYWPKSDFKQYLCKVHMFTKGKKIADPVFTDSHSQANSVFLIRYRFHCFSFPPWNIFYIWMEINFIKGLCYLGEMVC